MTYENMLACLMLPSGCDAAYALAANTARKVYGDSLTASQAVSAFVDLMNVSASDLGMTDTHYACPDGFPTSGHYTCAHDMAILGWASLTRDTIKRVVSQAKIPVYNADGSFFGTMYNTNDLVVPGSGHYLSYVCGIKTGWHSGAGYCLTTAAVQDTEYGERRLFAVVMGCSTKSERYYSLKYMYETAMAAYE